MGLSHLQIKQLFEETQLDAKAAKLRSKQIFHWIYHRGAVSFDVMTDISKDDAAVARAAFRYRAA